MEIALKEFPKLSSREIAKVCAVSVDTVCRARPEVSDSDTSSKRTGADGKSYPATKPAKTPGMKMLESMGATIVDMRDKVRPIELPTVGTSARTGADGKERKLPRPRTTTGGFFVGGGWAEAGHQGRSRGTGHKPDTRKSSCEKPETKSP